MEPRAGWRRDRALDRARDRGIQAGRSRGQRAGAAGDSPPGVRAARGPRGERQAAAARRHHPGLPRSGGRDGGGPARGRARRDVEDASHRRGASTLSCSLDGGAIPEYPAREHHGPRAAREPAGRPSRLPGPAGLHAAEPAVLAPRGGHGRLVSRRAIPLSSGAPRTRPRSLSSTSSTSAARRSSSRPSRWRRRSPRIRPCAAGWTSIPPVSLRFTSGVQLFAPGAARPVTVELTAARARAAGTVRAGGAGRLDGLPRLTAISTGKARRARPVHLHRDGTA